MAYTPGSDRYNVGVRPESPARMAAAVVKHDTTDLAPFAKALYVGATGDLTIVPAGDTSTSGTPVTFSNVPVGWFPVQVRRVMSTGTAASLIVAVFD